MIYDQELKVIVEKALEMKGTDIHFIQTDEKSVIKFRVNDGLVEYQQLSNGDYLKLILLIKYRSHMNLNNSKGPQSSAFDLSLPSGLKRIRVSTIITKHNESMVLRISHGHIHDELHQLLLNPKQVVTLTEAMNKRHGLILITGPTGSGKTTLAYALLNQVNQKGLSIVSVEDPVEHYERDFVQLQINEMAGVNYEVSVKEILRHDPDIIFIGEIRDLESAKSAIRASLTGHLVISTVHAISAYKALYRMIELGVSLTELEQVLLLVTNQRLVYANKDKRVALELLTQEHFPVTFLSMRNNTPYTYDTITDLLKTYSEYQVIK